ncbi:hypothetical protein D3C87_89320 [compost metagenome]
MKTKVFITGLSQIPKNVKDEKTFSTDLIEDSYKLREAIQKESGEKVIVVYLPFLEMKNFEMYSFLQKSTQNLKTFFVVNELSDSMKIKVKSHPDFVVLWKTEEPHLVQNIKTYLEGKLLSLRQDKRIPTDQRAMISPSKLPLGDKNKPFQPILISHFENLSNNGSCLKVQAPFYRKKDFVNLTYQNKEGDYVSLEGQVRWTKWNKDTEMQELGVYFVGC